MDSSFSRLKPLLVNERFFVLLSKPVETTIKPLTLFMKTADVGPKLAKTRSQTIPEKSRPQI